MTTKVTTIEAGPVARIVLGHAPMNLLDVAFMEEIAAAAKALAARPAAKRPRVLMLASSVRGQFCQGLDPNAVLATDIAGRKRIFYALANMVEALWLGGIPVVADISGPALAGGAVLAALADFALIDADAGRICFSEVKVGLPVPAFIQLIVRSKTLPTCWNEILVLGKNIDAPEAVRLGFAQAMYKGDERDELLQSLVGRIGRLPPAVVAQTLREGRLSGRAELDAFRADVGGAFADFLTDEFLGKGLAAIVKGESPKF